MMALSERDIRVFHYAIVHSVKTPNVVSELVAADVISTEDGDRIKKYFLRDEPAKGSEEMMQCFYRSTHSRKEQSLLMAFERSKYPYLKKLLEGTEFKDRSYTHTKKILQQFKPLLENGLYCADILPHLCSRGVLKDEDIEDIATVEINKGNTYAIIVLLERMQCRVSPEQWYYDFLDVLSKTGYEKFVKKLEPDFINNPSSFMPKHDSIVPKSSPELSSYEDRLLYHRDVFVRCIKDPKVVSLLSASSVISESDSTRLKDLYLCGDLQKATDELLDCVLKARIPRKWQLFLEALTEAEYPYLIQLLESSGTLTTSSQRERQIIRSLSPKLEETLYCLEIIPRLCSHGVLNVTDLEIILNLERTRGNTYGMISLLERMQCRAPPQVWYTAFLETLRNTGYQDIIKVIEKEFLKDPEPFCPSSEVQLDGKEECGDEKHPKEEGERIDYDSQDGDGSRRFEINSVSPNYTSLEGQLGEKEECGDENHGNEDRDKMDCDSQDGDGNKINSVSPHYTSSDEEGLTEFEPRAYQLELAENALLERNTIICAETGSGKTWVALHIIKEHLKKECNVRRKVVFMARTDALIKRQFDRFQKYLPEFRSKLITSEDDGPALMNMYVGDYDILCFTPQILVNSLEDKDVKGLSVFSLLVLDECHHTRGDEPYNRLMRRYLTEKKLGVRELPQVVGLTASFGTGKSRNDTEAMNYILKLMACLDVELLSTVERNREELKKYINVLEEETIVLRKPTYDHCMNIIMQAKEKTEDILQEKAFVQPNLTDFITNKHPHNIKPQEHNRWTEDAMTTAEIKVDIHRHISACAKYLNIYNSALEINKLLATTDVIKFLAEKYRLESEYKEELTDIERKLLDNLMEVQRNINMEGKNIENPNVRILSDTLRTLIEQEGDESRAMVFVKARATCKSLAAFLDKDLEKCGVQVSPLYGKENRGGDDGMRESVQTDVLDKFQSGVYKILVCTSVGNEGTDVPDCNIVLSYEYSADKITKIQMKGHSRNRGGKAMVMGGENVLDQDRTNAFKASMMFKAMAKVKQLDPKDTQRKIAIFQREEINKYHCEAEIKHMKKGRKSIEDCQILCKRCNVLACYASDVRQMGHNHIVICKEFTEKINRKPHTRPKTYDGITKKYKMYCKKCPLDWGIIGTKDGLEFMILKIQSFKFLRIETYKKWNDVPEKVPEIRLYDLVDW